MITLPIIDTITGVPPAAGSFFTELYDTRIETDSNGFSLNFQFYYNTVAKMWYINIADADKNSIVAGVAAVPSINLTDSVVGLPFFFGQLRVIDLAGDGNTTLTSFGATSLLIYYARGEFEQLYPDSTYTTGVATTDE